MRIRPAAGTDVPVIAALVRQLAEYEQLLDQVTMTEADLSSNLFGSHPHAEVLLAETDAGEVFGFALYFHTFSTFLGRPGLYLEDLYVRPEHRGSGAGKALLARLAALAVERGCGRVEWAVLDWNAPSIAFYEALGARATEGWTVYRLTGDALTGLADSGAAAT